MGCSYTWFNFIGICWLWSVMANQIYMCTVLLCNLMHSNMWTRRKFDKNTFGWVLKFLDLHLSLIFVSYYLIKIVTNLLTCVDRRKYLDTVKLTHITSIKQLPVLKCHLFLVLWIQALVYRGAAWSWSFGCWIYNYLCNLTVPITNKGVSLNPVHGEVYLIQHYVSLSVTCDRSVVSSTNKTDCRDIAEICWKWC